LFLVKSLVGDEVFCVLFRAQKSYPKLGKLVVLDHFSPREAQRQVGIFNNSQRSTIGGYRTFETALEVR